MSDEKPVQLKQMSSIIVFSCDCDVIRMLNW